MEKEPEKCEELLQVSDHALEGTAGEKADTQFGKRNKIEFWD